MKKQQKTISKPLIGSESFRISKIVFILAVFLVFLIYFFTSAPSLGLIDSGELTTAAYTLGIAHPTGYPLYTIMGRLFSLLPFADIARKMVVFSVFCMTVACGFLLWTARLVFQKCFGFSQFHSLVLACAAVLTFALSLIPWQNAAYAEVYPLTLLLVSILYAIGVRLLIDKKPDMRLWIVYGFVFGLALGNHLTVLWTFPLAIVALWHNFGVSRATFRALFAMVSAGIVGVSIILFLPIRSHLNPSLDWGNPETLHLLWKHLTGWQYQIWMFEEGIAQRLGNYFKELPSDIGWGGLILVLFGIIGLTRRAPQLLIALILVWFIGVLYNVNYDIPDIAPYFLPAHAALALIAAGGIATFWQFAKSKTKPTQVLFVALLIFPAASNAVTYFGRVNRSNDYFPISFAREVLRTLPPNALTLQSIWDVQSPIIYLQEVEEYRNDVVLLDINLMQRRWYIEQLSRQHPEIFKGCEREREAFLQELVPFEADKPYNAVTIERAFVAMHDSIISKNLSRRPVYLRFARESGHPQVGARFPAVPGAFFYRIGNELNEEELLDVERFIGSRTQFDEREKYLLTKVREILYNYSKFQPNLKQLEVARQLQLLDSVLIQRTLSR